MTTESALFSETAHSACVALKKYPSIDSWRVTSVLHRGLKAYPSLFRVLNKWTGYLDGDGNPWPLSGDQGVLADFYAFPSQLSGNLHFMKLVAEDEGAHGPAQRNYRSQENHPSIASPYAVNKRLLGYGWLAVAFAFVYAGIFLLMTFDNGRNSSSVWFNRNGLSRIPSWFRLLFGGLLCLVSVVIVGQGIDQIFGTP